MSIQHANTAKETSSRVRWAIRPKISEEFHGRRQKDVLSATVYRLAASMIPVGLHAVSDATSRCRSRGAGQSQTRGGSRNDAALAAKCVLGVDRLPDTRRQRASPTS